MNREQAKRIFESFGRPALVTPDGKPILFFARQTWPDVEEIEKMDNDRLVQHRKNMAYAGAYSISMNDLQRASLLDLEIQERIDKGTLSKEKVDKIAEEFQAWRAAGGAESEIQTALTGERTEKRGAEDKA